MSSYCIFSPNELRTRGSHRHATGELRVYHDKEGGVLPTIKTDDGQAAFIFDPRYIIVDQETHTVEYSPRTVPIKQHAKWVRDWIKEHAQWGVPGCEKDLLAAAQACTQH